MNPEGGVITYLSFRDVDTGLSVINQGAYTAP
jgi:hypothetical protein